MKSVVLKLFLRNPIHIWAVTIAFFLFMFLLFQSMKIFIYLAVISYLLGIYLILKRYPLNFSLFYDLFAIGLSLGYIILMVIILSSINY